jgi:pimeloyl-ACP methyl ester carboxylesterase
MSLKPPQMPSIKDGETQYFDYDLKLSPLSQPAGASFPARLAYCTYGDPTHPAVLQPTCYGGKLATTSPFLYNKASCQNPESVPPFPSDKYYVIIVGLLGGAESSSPSVPPSDKYKGADFPKVTYEDNMHLQKALCDKLGVKKLFLYTGFSMGGQQTYHMSVLYPDFVERVSAVPRHQAAFLNDNMLTLLSDGLSSRLSTHLLPQLLLPRRSQVRPSRLLRLPRRALLRPRAQERHRRHTSFRTRLQHVGTRSRVVSSEVLGDRILRQLQDIGGVLADALGGRTRSLGRE